MVNWVVVYSLSNRMVQGACGPWGAPHRCCSWLLWDLEWLERVARHARAGGGSSAPSSCHLPSRAAPQKVPVTDLYHCWSWVSVALEPKGNPLPQRTCLQEGLEEPAPHSVLNFHFTAEPVKILPGKTSVALQPHLPVLLIVSFSFSDSILHGV